ncbi:MAG: TolC family protein [Chryseolinea sp.]
MNYSRIIYAFSIACSVIVVHAQDQQLPSSLSFKEAVQIGLKNNMLLNQQKNQLDYTQVNKTSALLQMGPTVSAQGSLYRQDGNSFNQNEGRVVNGIIDFVNGSINANMPVFAGFTYLNQYRAANNNNEAQLYKVARANQDVIASVSNQYLLCLLDQELVKVNDQNVKAQKIIYDQLKEQAELGAKAESDVYNQEALWKNAELLLVRARNMLRNDIATLATTLQVDPIPYFQVEPVNWSISELFSDSTALEVMYTTAMEKRSDLKQATYAEKGARYFYHARKGYYFPNIYAGVSYGSRYNYIKGESNRSFTEQFKNDNTNLGYGLSINIPIFNAWAYKSQAAFAKVTYKNAQLTKKNAEVTLKSDVIKAYQNFNDAKKGYISAESAQKAGELAYRAEKEKYDLGVSNIVQLSTVNQTYVKAQGDFQNAKFNLMFQKLLINYAMGTLQIEDIP